MFVLSGKRFFRSLILYGEQEYWSKSRFKLERYMCRFNNSKSFEKIGWVYSYYCIFSLDTSYEMYLTLSNLRFWGLKEYSTLATKAHLYRIIIFSWDEIYFPECLHNICSIDNSLCRVVTRKEVCVIWKFSIE